MGARGKGAITQPKEPPKANGRPRNKGPRRVIVRARKHAIETVEFLHGVAQNPDEEMRYRLRAASELLRIACLDVDQPQTPEEAEKFEIEFVKDWNATPS